MKIATVITAHNEGPEVAATVKSMAASMRDPQTELLVVVVDDGSTDGSADSCELRGESCDSAQFSIRVVRHDKPLGVGRARNAGLAVALEWGADVVSFHDGHMRFPQGVIEALAAKAVGDSPALHPQITQIAQRTETEGGGRRAEVRSAVRAERVPVSPSSVKSAESADSRFPAIITSKAKGWWFDENHPQVKAGKVKAGDEHSFRAWGADMHWNSGYGLQPKYRLYANKEPGGQPDWARVPCPMGACYVFSRRTIERLTAPTGRLWDDVAGRWGFSEQALAVKAFLLDIPVLVSRDLATHHHYRNSNPVPNAGVEIWKNVCWSMAALLSEETFDLRFRDFCETRLGKEECSRIVAAARKDAARHPQITQIAQRTERQDGDKHTEANAVRATRAPASPLSVESVQSADSREDMIWTHLLGRSPTITKPHSNHAWLSQIRETVSSDLRPPTSVLRVLQWRPGESTVLLRKAFPDAEITALEWFPHRTQNWRALCKRLRVKLHQTTLEAWTNPVQAGFLKGQAPFDLITIGGELADQCLPAAKGLVAPGGWTVINRTADALQIEDAERKKTGELMKAAVGGRKAEVRRQKTEGDRDPKGVKVPVPLSPSSASPRLRGSPSVTVVLLNWKRAENIGLLLNCLQKQTAKPRVVVWDNGFGVDGGLKWSPPNGPLLEVHLHPLVDLAVYSSGNLGCFPRWQLAAHCQTEYVCSLDDDLMFKDPRVLEDAITAHRTLCPDGIVGMFGWRRVEGRDYKGGRHMHGANQDVRVDVIKGRFMLLRREQLERVPTVHPAALPEDYVRADDVYVSLCISEGKPGHHLVPGVLGKRWEEVGHQDGRALASDAGHYKSRGDLVERMLAYYGGRKSEIGGRLTADH